MRAENRSVRKMAESYIRMIKEVQRHGPYYLAGQSFGGLVAYEIANILTEQCEDVAFMAMIDTFPWYLPNRTGAARLEMLFSGTRLEKLMDGLLEVSRCIVCVCGGRVVGFGNPTFLPFTSGFLPFLALKASVYAISCFPYSRI